MAMTNIKAILGSLAGIFWAFLGVGLFGLIYVIGKFDAVSANTNQIIWFRYLGALITVSIIILLSKDSSTYLRTEQMYLHAIRSLSGGLGGMAAIYAAKNMPVSSATAIGLLDGLFTVFLGVFFLKEIFKPAQWLAVIICLSGSLLVALSQEDALQMSGAFIFPASMALTGAMLVAIESILIKTLARSQNALTVLFYVSLFGSIIFLLLSVLNWRAISLWEASLLLLLGPIAVLAQFFNILAFRACDATVVGSVRYTWIIWGAFFGYVFFNESPTLAVYMGCTLILTGGVILALVNYYAKPSSESN